MPAKRTRRRQVPSRLGRPLVLAKVPAKALWPMAEPVRGWKEGNWQRRVAQQHSNQWVRARAQETPVTENTGKVVTPSPPPTPLLAPPFPPTHPIRSRHPPISARPPPRTCPMPAPTPTPTPHPANARGTAPPGADHWERGQPSARPHPSPTPTPAPGGGSRAAAVLTASTPRTMPAGAPDSLGGGASSRLSKNSRTPIVREGGGGRGEVDGEGQGGSRGWGGATRGDGASRGRRALRRRGMTRHCDGVRKPSGVDVISIGVSLYRHGRSWWAIAMTWYQVARGRWRK